jgi:hypothetical protein
MKKPRKPDVPRPDPPDQRKPYDLPPPTSEPDPSQPPNRQEDPPPEEPERGSRSVASKRGAKRTSRSSIEQPIC